MILSAATEPGAPVQTSMSLLKAARRWNLYRQAVLSCPTERGFIEQFEKAEIELSETLQRMGVR